MAAEPLAERVRGGQLRQLGDQPDGVTDQEVGLDAVLGHGDPQLVQPGRRRDGEPMACHVGQRGAAPQVQGPAQQVGPFGGFGLRAGRRGQPLELHGVDVGRGDTEPVSARRRLDQRPAAGTAQPGHQGL